jgi:hypothetical protein
VEDSILVIGGSFHILSRASSAIHDPFSANPPLSSLLPPSSIRQICRALNRLDGSFLWHNSLQTNLHRGTIHTERLVPTLIAGLHRRNCNVELYFSIAGNPDPHHGIHWSSSVGTTRVLLPLLFPDVSASTPNLQLEQPPQHRALIAILNYLLHRSNLYHLALFNQLPVLGRSAYSFSRSATDFTAVWICTCTSRPKHENITHCHVESPPIGEKEQIWY